MKKDPVQITINTYNDYACEYFERNKSSDDQDIMKTRLDKFIELIKGNRVIDIGTGVGSDAMYLSKKGFSVTSIDLADEFIKIAIKDVPNATFLKMDMRELTFNDNFFDGVWANCSVIHLPKSDIKKTLRGFRRILKDNGVLFISFKEGSGEKFVKNKGKGNLDGAIRYFSFYTYDEIEKILKKAGFKIIGKRTGDSRKNVWLDIFCEVIPNH